MRYPIVAGQFYEDNEPALRTQVEECYTSFLGPGKVPDLAATRIPSIKGIVSPHAGYMFSGPVAAHGFSALAKEGFPETFIIIGPNHTGMGAGVGMTYQDFQTPFGVAKVDRELAMKISTGIIEDSIASHRHEHSLEVQLPFIQHLQPDMRFVPICMMLQDWKTAREVGRIIRESIAGKDVVVIASSDFSHYVSPETARAKDDIAIQKILKLDAKGLYSACAKHNISACGYGPIMAMLEAVKGSSAELLKYATSGDVRPMAEVVGYASIIVR